jgi:hypothetical protein
MTMQLPQVNILAVVVATVIQMVIGALWYSPVLFSKQWLIWVNRKPEEINSDPKMYLFTAIAWLITSFVLALVVRAFGATTFVDGVVVGLLVWAGFSATATFVSTLFAGPNQKVWGLFAGYQLVTLVIGAVLLTLWR